MRTRKRSRHVALILAGTATLALAACKDEQVDAQSFPDLQSCVAAAKDNSLWFTEDDCRANFAAAQQELLETAPRYDSKELCEQEHGVGNCGGDPAAQAAGGDPAQQTASGGGGMGSVFMPMLMGMMLGNMLSRGGGIFSQPMVQTANGRFATPKGDQSFASNRGAGRVTPQTFNRAPSTMGRPPMTPASVAQRGGFGASSTARSTSGSSRGFGG